MNNLNWVTVSHLISLHLIPTIIYIWTKKTAIASQHRSPSLFGLRKEPVTWSVFLCVANFLHELNGFQAFQGTSFRSTSGKGTRW